MHDDRWHGMTQPEFEEVMKDVVVVMKAYVMPFTTPIGRVVETQPGDQPGAIIATAAELWGTGNYVDHDGTVFLVSNEHVIREVQNSRLTYQFYKHGGGVRPQFLQGPKVPTITYPVDAGVANVDQHTWKSPEHDGRAIPVNHFAEKHAPVQGELLFMLGYSGQRSTFLFDYLYTPSTPYLTVEANAIGHADFSPQHHFALHYNPEDAKAVEPDGRPLPIPRGFSGSFVWNTRRIQCLTEGRDWSPSEATVTGVIWGWPSSTSMLFATRVEYVAEFLRHHGFPELQRKESTG